MTSEGVGGFLDLYQGHRIFFFFFLCQQDTESSVTDSVIRRLNPYKTAAAIFID